MARKWYVIRVISGKELKIKENILQEIEREGFKDMVNQILVPTEKVFQIRNGKKISKQKVYFPGYITIDADLDGEVLHVIKSVIGVMGFLSETRRGDPLPMREEEVKRLLGKVDELIQEDETIGIPYVRGETIKIIDGPFNDFDGIIENINEPKRKLEVMVKIFGRKTPIELNFMQVQKI